MTTIPAARCDAPGCFNPPAFITRGYVADGTSPTWNEACTAHAGDIAANYLNAPTFGRLTFVRASIERITAS